MSGCPGRKKEILRYAAGDLRRAASASLEAHVEECPGCRAELEAARALEALLREPSIEAPGPGFRRGVLHAIDRWERERLVSRVGEIARARRHLVSRGDLLPAGLLTAAALVAGLLLLPEAATFARLLSAGGASASPGAWARAAMTFLGAQGASFNTTYLYPPVVLLSIGFGLLHVFGLDTRPGVRALFPIEGDG